MICWIGIVRCGSGSRSSVVRDPVFRWSSFAESSALSCSVDFVVDFVVAILFDGGAVVSRGMIRSCILFTRVRSRIFYATARTAFSCKIVHSLIIARPRK